MSFLYDLTAHVYTHRLAHTRVTRVRLIVCADCVAAAVIHNVTADVILHALADTITVITAQADALVFVVADRHALRVLMALRGIHRAIGQHALIVHLAVFGLAGALVARAAWVQGASFVLPAVGVFGAFV